MKSKRWRPQFNLFELCHCCNAQFRCWSIVVHSAPFLRRQLSKTFIHPQSTSSSVLRIGVSRDMFLRCSPSDILSWSGPVNFSRFSLSLGTLICLQSLVGRPDLGSLGDRRSHLEVHQQSRQEVHLQEGNQLLKSVYMPYVKDG